MDASNTGRNKHAKVILALKKLRNEIHQLNSFDVRAFRSRT